MAPRKLKPHDVATFQHEEVQFQVLLDREAKDFFVKLDEVETIRGASLAECSRAFKERMKTFNPFVWKGMIDIDFNDHDGTSYGGGHLTHVRPDPVDMSLNFERYEVAERNGEFFTRMHPLDWEKFMREDPRLIRITRQYRWAEQKEDTLRVEYTDERWQELLTVRQGLLDARAKLKKLFTTDFKLISAAAKAGRLLGTGK